MTPEAFIAVASGLAAVKAKTVLGAVRLAVHGRTFATVGWPSPGWAVVKLAAADQEAFVEQSPAVTPDLGARGRNGVTLLALPALADSLAQRVMLAAWRHAQAVPGEMAKTG